MDYATRAEQVDNFATELFADCRKAGHPIDRSNRDRIAKALRLAAMVGACAERSRTLGIIRTKGHPVLQLLEDDIIDKAVLDVLGYGRRKP